MKGTTEIILTDCKTGEQEIIREENMITNAAYDVFNKNIEANLFMLNGSPLNFSNNMVPICPNTIGGILLFADPLTEDVNNYYAPSNKRCIGFASNDVNETADELRGSMNQTESMKIEGGYKFVWDFATSQGNGTIASLALTHKFGGVGYVGNMFDNNARLLLMKRSSSRTDPEKRTIYTYAVEVNFEENYLWAIGFKTTANEIVLRKARKCFTKLGLTATLTEDGDEILEEHVITPSVFIKTSPTTTYGLYGFYDGKDGYWYGFMNNSNSSGDCTMKWIKINKSNFSFTEGTWVLPDVQVLANCTSQQWDTNPHLYRNSVLVNGYLYLMGHNHSGLYKMNINNPADISFIDLGFISNFEQCRSGYQTGSVAMWAIDDWIFGSDFRINSNGEVTHLKETVDIYDTTTPLFRYGPYVISFGAYNSRDVMKNMWLYTPYLASINNLQTAVVKTADKTMKITYTVTEV